MSRYHNNRGRHINMRTPPSWGGFNGSSGNGYDHRINGNGHDQGSFRSFHHPPPHVRHHEGRPNINRNQPPPARHQEVRPNNNFNQLPPVRHHEGPQLVSLPPVNRSVIGSSPQANPSPIAAPVPGQQHGHRAAFMVSLVKGPKGQDPDSRTETPLSILHQICTKEKLERPNAIEETYGEGGAQIFHCKLQVIRHGKIYEGIAAEKSKKAAKQDAARDILSQMNIFVEKHVSTKVSPKHDLKVTPVLALGELCALKKWMSPKYEEIWKPHERIFTVSCKVWVRNIIEIEETAEAGSRKDAKYDAAMKVYRRVQEILSQESKEASVLQNHDNLTKNAETSDMTEKIWKSCGGSSGGPSHAMPKPQQQEESRDWPCQTHAVRMTASVSPIKPSQYLHEIKEMKIGHYEQVESLKQPTFDLKKETQIHVKLPAPSKKLEDGKSTPKGTERKPSFVFSKVHVQVPTNHLNYGVSKCQSFKEPQKMHTLAPAEQLDERMSTLTTSKVNQPTSVVKKEPKTELKSLQEPTKQLDGRLKLGTLKKPTSALNEPQNRLEVTALPKPFDEDKSYPEPLSKSGEPKIGSERRDSPITPPEVAGHGRKRPSSDPEYDENFGVLDKAKSAVSPGQYVTPTKSPKLQIGDHEPKKVEASPESMSVTVTPSNAEAIRVPPLTPHLRSNQANGKPKRMRALLGPMDEELLNLLVKSDSSPGRLTRSQARKLQGDVSPEKSKEIIFAKPTAPAPKTRKRKAPSAKRVTRFDPQKRQAEETKNSYALKYLENMTSSIPEHLLSRPIIVQSEPTAEEFSCTEPFSLADIKQEVEVIDITDEDDMDDYNPNLPNLAIINVFSMA